MDSQSKQRHSNDNHRLHGYYQQAVRCANCDIEILWTPVIVQGKPFCCIGCAAGGPCNCDYSQYHSVNISGVIHYTPEEDTPEHEAG